MAFSRSVFSVLLLCVACRASVPVFLWGDLVSPPTLKANPLTLTTTPAFSQILSEELANGQFAVVFIENKLSNEDLSLKSGGQSAFKYLHANVKKSIYLPSVENAVEAFYLLDEAENVDNLLQTDFNLEITTSSSKNFLFINLDDEKIGESRAELLRRHDDFIQTTVGKLQKEHEKVVALYTGRRSGYSRVRRQAETQVQQANDLLLDGVRLYAKTIKLVTGGNSVVLQGLSSSTSEINSTSLTTKTTLNFNDRSIILSFRGTAGYWFFETVTVNPGTADAIELSPDIDIYALNGFSYRCAQEVTFSFGNTSETTSVHFEDFKIQAQFEHTNESAPLVFGDPFHCVGFFSAPIWAGLFVVFILLAITFYGIMMMMDMKTMDRFDDPKGKTINIIAQE